MVIHPDHIGSDSAILKPGQALAAMKAAVEDTSNMVNRPLDVSFVIASLPSIAGHSFGAYTAMAVAETIIHLPGGATRTLADPRVRAFIAMSPQGTGASASRPTRGRPSRGRC